MCHQQELGGKKRAVLTVPACKLPSSYGKQCITQQQGQQRMCNLKANQYNVIPYY